jgi:acyl carrier protein phosphodiesterase
MSAQTESPPLTAERSARSERRDILSVIALVLCMMDEVLEGMSKPGAQLETLQQRWHRLEIRYQELMERLAQAPYEAKPEGKQSER